MAEAEARIRISAQDNTRQAFESVNQSLSRAQSGALALKAAFAGLGAGAAIAGIGRLVTATINLADELGKLSSRTGISVESLSALKQAGELADVSIDDLRQGFRQLNLSLVEAQDRTSKTAQVFRALGVDTTQGAEVAFRGLADSLSQIPDAATRVAVAQELLGRSGEKLIPLLEGGAKGLDEARKASDNFGTTLSTKVAQEAQEFNDNLTRLRQSAGALGVSLTGQLLPPLVEVTNNLVKAREQGSLFRQVLLEIDGLLARGLAGFESLVSGGASTRFADEAARVAARNAGAAAGASGRTAVGRIGGLETGPPAPARLDPNALAEALRGGNRQSTRAAGQDPFARLLEQQAATLLRQQVDQANAELAADAEGVRARQELLEFYADLALAQQLRIDLAETEATTAFRSLQQEAEALRDRLDPTREYERSLQRIAELEERNLITTREAVAATAQLSEAFKAAQQAGKEADRLSQQIGLTFSSAFEDAIAGARGLRDILKGIEQDLLRLGTRQLVTKPLFDAFGDLLKPGSGGGGNLIQGLLGSIGFGGARAMGGPVAAGMGYLVGERGPELFLPRQSGTVVPNGATVGGATIVMNISTPDVNSFRQSQGQLMAQANDLSSRAARRNR